jgi:hypothetical protein
VIWTLRSRIAIAVVLLLLAGGREIVRRLPVAAPQTVASHSDEAYALQKAMAGVSRADRQQLAAVYGGLATAIESGRLIENTEQLMMGTSYALDLAFGGKKLLPGDGIGPQVDAVVEAAIGGRGAVSITDANRPAIVRGLREVVWACGG